MICNICKKEIDKKLDGARYCSVKCRDARRAYAKKVRESEKYKAWCKKYRQSEAFKASFKRYHKSEKGKACKKKYQQSEKGKEYAKKYWQSEKYKAYIKEYRKSEKYKTRMKKYRQSDKHKAYVKKYNRTRVTPKKAVTDFMLHFGCIKFHSVEEFEETINNYGKAACTIQGNCVDVTDRIRKSDWYEKTLRRIIDGQTKKHYFSIW